MGKVEVKARIRKMTMKNRESKERVKQILHRADNAIKEAKEAL